MPIIINQLSTNIMMFINNNHITNTQKDKLYMQSSHYAEGPTVIKKQLEQCILKLNNRNLYQKLLIAFFSVEWVLIAFISMIGPFVFMNPIFHCQGQQKPEHEACLQLNQCSVVNNFTAVQYTQLYCGNQYLRSLIQSILFIGAIVSMFTIVSASDSKGRRFSIITAFSLQITGVILIIIGIYTKIWELIVLGQFLNGLFMANATIVSYVITGQFSNDKMRQKSIMIYCAMWGFGEMLFLPIYYLLPQWYNYLILLILFPSIGLFAIALFFLLQSPYYCIFMAKDINKFKQTILYISMYNNSSEQDIEKTIKVAQKLLATSQKEQMKQKISLKQSIKSLIKDKPSRTACLCIALSQSAFNVYYSTMQGSMERTGYNFGISMFLAGLHEFLGYLFVSFIADKIPRKKGLIVTTIISSLVGLSFLLSFIKNSEILQSVAISLARFCSVFGYSFIAFLQTQSFPTQIKSTAIGFTDGLSQITKIFVPILIIQMNELGVHPLIISSLIYLLIGIIPILFVKQTHSKKQIHDGSSSRQQKSQIQSKLMDNEVQQTAIN